MMARVDRLRNIPIPSVGLIIPAGNTVMEGDYHRELTGKWAVHTSRMMLEEVTAEGEQRMLDEEGEPAARRLYQTKPLVVVFGCTSASSLHGDAYDEVFRRRLSKAVGAPVLGVLKSVIAMLVDAGPIALFTPYIAELSDRIAASLQAGGIQVEKVASLGISDIGAIGAITPMEIVQEVQSMDLRGVRTVFCSCTNLRAYEAREDITAVTNRNVITSNHASVEAVLAFAAKGDEGYSTRSWTARL